MLRAIATVITLLAGCGAAPAPSGNSEPFPEVTDAMRQACFFLTDPHIAAGVSFYEADRVNGHSYNEILISAANSCSTNPPESQLDCLACSTAIADDVYGR